MRSIIVIAHNLRSTHNVGSLLRTAEGLGVAKIWLTGYTPYPLHTDSIDDIRLPHEAIKLDRQIAKTALGAENSAHWEHTEDIHTVLSQLRKDGYHVVALEQHPKSVQLPAFQPPHKVALLLGREVEGVEPELLAITDGIIEIPMYGKKESFNVVQAAAMALYHCRFLA